MGKDAMTITTAYEFIEAVVDDATFETWDTPPNYGGLAPDYEGQLGRARDRSGVDESVVTGRGTLAGMPVAIIASEFNFLAGTIGRASSERLTQAFERAERERLPLIASPVSGGTRMQEGTHAFLQLMKISAALSSYRQAGLPYLVYIRNPMTGGPVVSWGSLGQVTYAEPEALVGLLGPRVVEALTGSALPEGVQTAENLTELGIIDDVVEIKGLRRRLISILRTVTAPHVRQSPPVMEFDPPERPAWDSIEAAAHPVRTRLGDLIDRHAQEYTPLLGTDQRTYHGSVRAGLARFVGFSCMLLGHSAPTSADVLTPEGLTVIQRAITIASEMALPIVAIIDTPGVEITVRSEELGFAREIARTVELLIGAPPPVISVVLGSGMGVSALTLLPSDRTICAENAFIAPLPPSAASEILHRTMDRAPELAHNQGIRSTDLLQTGLIDTVVPETIPDAGGFSQRLVDAISASLSEVHRLAPAERLDLRRQRYRRVY